MTSPVQNKPPSNYCDQFNFSSNAKIRICKGIVLSSLALSAAYVLHSVAYPRYLLLEQSTSPIDRARLHGVQCGILAGIICGLGSTLLLRALLLQSQTEGSPSGTHHPYIHPKAQ